MSTRQIVYEEGDTHELEILSDVGAEILVECFKYDFLQYANYYGGSTLLTEPTWDDDQPQNWDYMLMAAKDLFEYCEFMADYAELCNDMQASYSYQSAMAMFDELQQQLGEVFDHVNGDEDICKHDLDTFKFWSDVYNTVLYASQCMELVEIEGGLTQ